MFLHLMLSHLSLYQNSKAPLYLYFIKNVHCISNYWYNMVLISLCPTMYPCIIFYHPSIHVSTYTYIYPWCVQKSTYPPSSFTYFLTYSSINQDFFSFLIKDKDIETLLCAGVTCNVNKKVVVFKKQSPFACSNWYLPSSIYGDPTLGRIFKRTIL